jgi:hypothetical protein
MNYMSENKNPFSGEEKLEITYDTIESLLISGAEILPDQRKYIDGSTVQANHLIPLKVLAGFDYNNTIDYWAKVSGFSLEDCKLIALKYGIKIQNDGIVSAISIVTSEAITLEYLEKLANYYGE